MEPFNQDTLKFLANIIYTAGLAQADPKTEPLTIKAQIISKIIAGLAHGFDPVSAQSNLNIIKGRCVLSNTGFAIKFSRHPYLKKRVDYLNSDGCKITILEQTSTDPHPEWIERGTVEVLYKEIEKSGISKKNAVAAQMWAEFREDMLYSTALRRACKRYATEILDANFFDAQQSALAQLDVKDVKDILTLPAPSNRASGHSSSSLSSGGGNPDAQ